MMIRYQILIVLIIILCNMIVLSFSDSNNFTIDSHLKEHLLVFPIDEDPYFSERVKGLTKDDILPLLTLINDATALERLVDEVSKKIILSTDQEKNVIYIRSRILLNIFMTLGSLVEDVNHIKAISQWVLRNMYNVDDYFKMAKIQDAITALGMIRKPEAFQELKLIVEETKKLPDMHLVTSDIKVKLQWHIVNTIIQREKSEEYNQIKPLITHLNTEQWNKLDEAFSIKTTTLNPKM